MASKYTNVTHFDPLQGDTFDFGGTVTGVDPAVIGGTLISNTFDINISLAMDADHLSAHHAALYEPNAGNMAGKVFLVVDMNGVAGYQAGKDAVIHLNHASNLDHIDASTFV